MTDNKKIAKNTFMLYVRTLLIMLVGLYTSRVVLRELGESDFGIYNVVGGVVVLFTFINGAVATAVQRYLNFEIGRGDYDKTNQIFSSSMMVMVTIAVAVVILAETVGLWLLETQLNIPPERMGAARWVFQFSIVSCVISVMRVPYNAMIVAHEEMSFYAWLGIIEAAFKLIIALLLCLHGFDKLILYAGMMVLATLATSLLYVLFCKQKFAGDVKFSFVKDRILYKELLSFSGWTLAGSAADIGSTQGINMLINIFGSVIVNAAAGIANQLSGLIYNLIKNFQTAFRPQIIKNYAANEMEEFHTLVYRSSKFSFFLLFFISFPIILNLDFLLEIWLDDFPEYSVQFAFWTFLYMMVDAMSAPLWMSAQATGKIRNYQIMVSLLILTNIPVAWLILKMGFAPVWVFISKFIINLITHMGRQVYLHVNKIIPMDEFNRKVTARIVAATCFAVPLPLYISMQLQDGWMKLLITGSISVVIAGISVFLLGMDKKERRNIIKLIKSKL